MTARLKLLIMPEQFQALRQTQVASRDMLNAVSCYAFAHGKLRNQQRLQCGCYDGIRLRSGLPVPLACNVPRQVGVTRKSLWAKARKNAEQGRVRWTRKSSRRLARAPHYVSPTLTYNYYRDHGLKEGQQVNILTLSGRVILPYTGYDKHVALLARGARIGATRLWYDRSRKRFYLLNLEVADPTPETQQRVSGGDVSQRSLAIVARQDHDTSFFSGHKVRARANYYAQLRKRLQKKGTRAATRRLVIAARERRLRHERNHVLSRRIVDQHPPNLIGLENLTPIRERTRGQRSPQAIKKQRRAIGHASSRVFAVLHGFLTPKALPAGSMAVKVDADYTSLACPRCGYTCVQNSVPAKGSLCACRNSKYRLPADLVGARNVAMYVLRVR